MALRRWWAGVAFDAVHRHRLVYNTCWEDPRLDRVALALGPESSVVAITSAGCNVLDYALDAPARIDAVDLNPRQNALLELKQAGIRSLQYDDFFQLFGRGVHPGWPDLYRTRLRSHLSGPSAEYWDRHGAYFRPGAGRSFYYRGTTGLVARAMRLYVRHVARVRSEVETLLECRSLDEQREVYARIRRRVLTPFLRSLLRRDATMALLAVPRPQREHLERDHSGGIASFIESCLDAVFTTLPLSDNYFWQLYLRGHYTESCAPEYLKPASFARLKAGLVDRIHVHTGSLTHFFERHDRPVTHAVLLDHMDWLCDSGRTDLVREWEALIARAAPYATIIWRSGGVHTDFVDTLPVRVDRTRDVRVGELLTYARALASSLHPQDRVHTYGSFHIATLSA